MRIVFMGTPDIAAICLSKLFEAGREVVGVVTGEDKARGRGNVLTPTPVKSLALQNNVPVYTPKTLRDEAFMDILRELSPDIIVVVAYGKILPKEVLFYPKHGSINVHVSLLPKYRGAAPMQRAIMDGEKETGVTIMYMDEGLDTGDIVLTERFPIDKKDNFETIHDKSAEIGGPLLLRTIEEIEKGNVKRVKQDESLATYAKKVEKEDCLVDFSLDAKTVSARVRGVTPIPGAFTHLNGKMLKIARVKAVSGKGNPGEVIEASGIGDGFITVACKEGAIKILQVTPEGKGKMSAGDFVRGRKIAVGDMLG